MTNDQRLRTLFLQLASYSLLTSLAGATACSGNVDGDDSQTGGPATTGSGGGTTTGSGGATTTGSGGGMTTGGGGVTMGTGGTTGGLDFVVPSCSEDGLPPGFNPGESVDYYVVRSALLDFEDSFGEATDEGATGAACDGAADHDACMAELAAAMPTSTGDWTVCGQIGCTHYALVSTSGSDVSVRSTKAEVIEFLGEIDTSEEARFVAQMDGYRVSCDEPSVRETTAGYELIATRTISDCPVTTETVRIRVAPDGTIERLEEMGVEESNVCVGRRPEGLVSERSPETGSRTGVFFAATARLEAAAVDAFEVIAEELDAFGAPRSLADRARAAADDERRHARVTGSFAERFGGSPKPPQIDRRSLRSLGDFARDNAVEGCVRETFGALVATYQGKASRDRAVARAMTEIAEDETRHAALSWDIARWVESRLDDVERQSIVEARRRAIADLRREVVFADDPELAPIAGMPCASAALLMLDALEQHLWGDSGRLDA